MLMHEKPWVIPILYKRHVPDGSSSVFVPSFCLFIQCVTGAYKYLNFMLTKSKMISESNN